MRTRATATLRNTGGGGGRPMGGDSFDTAFLSTFLIAVMMGTIDLYLV